MTAALAMGRRLLAVDEAIFLWLRSVERRPLTWLMRTLTAVGDTWSWALQGLLLACASRGCALLALHLGLAAGLATAVVQVLKHKLRRARPSVAIAGFRGIIADPDAFSFPSGHSAVAFAVAIALRAFLPWAAPFGLVLACGIGSSRVYLGNHYPLDVACGALIGVCCGAAIACLI